MHPPRRIGVMPDGKPAPFTKIVKSAAPKFSSYRSASPLEMRRAMDDNGTLTGGLPSNIIGMGRGKRCARSRL